MAFDINDFFKKYNYDDEKVALFSSFKIDDVFYYKRKNYVLFRINNDIIYLY